MNELSRNASHLKNLHGVIAVFQYLTANISENNKVSRLSYMNLEEAFALFLSYHEDTTEYSIRDSYQRNQFKNLLCLHYIEYILLRSRDIDLEYFSTDMLSSKKNNFYNKFDFNDEKFIEDSLNTMDTAFSGYFFYLS